MARLLHILAHPTPAQSRTARLAEAFLDSYRATHPDDEVELLDLYRDPVSYLSAAHYAATDRQDRVEEMSEDERRAWEEITRYIHQLKAADKILVTAPTWNFTVPAILKAYVDLVVLAGHTFRYAKSGEVTGLLTGRRAMLITTRGGIYSIPPQTELEMCISYLQAILEFLGIEVRGAIVAEGTNYLTPAVIEHVMAAAVAHAREAAETF